MLCPRLHLGPLAILLPIKRLHHPRTSRPYKESAPAILRQQHPNSPIASLRLKQVLQHYIDIIQALPEKPIIIGHSFGGLLTQLLVNRDLAAAGICLHPVPPKGVMPFEFSSLRCVVPSFGFLSSSKKTYLMSLSGWQYAFTNGMSLADQKASYDACVVPESKLLSRDGISSDAKVDFKKPHAPLLIIGGMADHIMPGTLSKRIFKAYSQSNGSITEFKSYEGINHYVCGLPGWQGHANDILQWVQS
jgi:pimeloyl-ACP methyl ester carboxylesterase